MIRFFRRGALTSKPYSFIARPWEFKTIESIDFFDSTLSSIRLDLRGDKILRVLPRINENINEEWISDRVRFSVDGFRSQRVDRPFITIGDATHVLSWSIFIGLIHKLFISIFDDESKHHSLKGLKVISKIYDRVPSIKHFLPPFRVVNSGVFTDFESSIWLNFFKSTFLIRKLFFKSKISNLNSRNYFFLPVSFKDFFKIKNLLLIAVNPRFESPILNIRLRQSVIRFGNTVSSLGQNFTPNFSLLLHSGILSLISFLRGNHWLCSFFSLNKQSLVLINSSFDNYLNSFNFLKNVKIGMFNCYSSKINLKEAGLELIKGSNTVFDKFPTFELFFGSTGTSRKKKNCFGSIRSAAVSHGGPNLLGFDLILPISAPFERNSNYINLEGNPKLSRFVLPSPNNVLDFKDSIIILLTHFSSNDSIVFYKTITLFLSSGIYVRLFSNNKRLVWSIIYKLLSSFFVSKSLFIKEFFPLVLEYIEEIPFSLDSCFGEYYSPKQESSLLLSNKNSGSFFETTENFYIQDDISRSSFSMLAANDRLITNQNYI